MKKLLLPVLALTGALFLYNCTGDDAALLNNTNAASDSLQPGDTIAVDTTTTDSVYVPVDSLFVPGDSVFTDTISVPVPPPLPFILDSLATPVDSLQ